MLVFATSDKGGTGRSVTSSNLMYRSALNGHSVCYVDCDFGSPTSGTVFGIDALSNGTTSESGMHAYLQGQVAEPQRVDVWTHSDRMSLRNRPPGTGSLTLLPGDAGGGEFMAEPEMVHRFVKLFLTLEEEYDIVLVDLSAGRSYATELVLKAVCRPELESVPARWLVFHRWTRQHVSAAAALIHGRNGLRDAAAALERDPEQMLDEIRVVRTAVVDPHAHSLAGLRGSQIAWLRAMDRELQVAAGQLGIGRSVLLGSVPLDPVLQWREQLITNGDVWERQIADARTAEAFETLAARLLDDEPWQRR